LKNTQVVLARRPNGYPVPEDFRVEDVELIEPQEGQALVKNLYISLDAGFRNWMDEGAGDAVLPAMPLDQPVMGLVVGRVHQSNNPALAEGQLVMARLAWQAWSIANADDFVVPLDDIGNLPLSYHLGVLGDTGMSGYFGLKDIGQPKPTDTVLVSAAGGAVGIVAGQVARILGAKTVVGFAGSDEKCRRLESEVGYDKVINYRAGNVSEQLGQACPNGVDVYFDNVGGALLEVVLDHITHGARIPFCGAVSDYNQNSPGPSNLFNIVTNSASLTGFMTHERVDRYGEARDQLTAWLQSGELKAYEQVYEGVEKTGLAFCDLFAGNNFGKTVVRVSS
jgi:NADPH-dependent curcumin reductase CurA